MSESSITTLGRIATVLELDFGGWFMTRLATDPDPTNETRGISGYTMALASEPRLDQVIRLQLDPDERHLLRDPGPEVGVRVGVDVQAVRFDGAPYPAGEELFLGARMNLEGANPPFDGPIFESRNNIVGSDDTMMFIINPFELAVYPPGGDALPGPGDALLRAKDYLDPGQPRVPVWAIEDPSTYARRLPTSFVEKSDEVLNTIAVYHPHRYFEQRLAWLQTQLQRHGNPESLASQQLKSRIFQIDLWGARVWSKLAYQLNYGFRTNGEQTVHERVRALGEFDTVHPWNFTCWFGGWDGDLLVGYCKGTLAVPFKPRA